MDSFGIIGSVKTLHTFIWIVAAAVAFADASPFERYQTIIDRKPFGPEPVNFDPEATPGSASYAGGSEDGGEMTPEQRTAEEQQLAASVRVSILNVTPAGVVKVGFTDSSANPPENYYMAVGGSQNGWTVKSADPSTESVTLEKGGVEVTVKLGESVGGGKDGKPGMPRRGNMSTKGLPGQRGGDSRMAAGGMGGLARLREQRRKQQAEEAERKRDAEMAAEVAQREREEREAREAEEKARAAEERAQQREALMQIQEQLKKAREEREAARNEQQQEGQGEANDTD